MLVLNDEIFLRLILLTISLDYDCDVISMFHGYDYGVIFVSDNSSCWRKWKWEIHGDRSIAEVLRS